MKLIKNRSKGSVLIAVIGILAVMSVMALRFNVEMETAMIKTGGKQLASDVKILANSGLLYCIAGILKNGKHFSKENSNSNHYSHSQLAIEEELEMKIKSTSPMAPDEAQFDQIGSGVPLFGAEQYRASKFFESKMTSQNSRFIPEGKNLAPGDISFMVEDLSAKLPIGHVSQWFQRHLISCVLSKLLTNQVPITKGFNTFEAFEFSEPVAELFEETKEEVNRFDYADGRFVYLRSLIPYEFATTRDLPKAHLNAAGLPFADGIFTTEELGSSYSWAKFLSKESEKKHATDSTRNTNDYLLLASALTPYTRFSHERNFTDRSTYPNQASPVSYASINPMVMYHQNERLYYSLFNYEAVDLKLRNYFSVSFDPLPKDIGIYATDNTENQITAIADRNFYKNRVDGNILTTITSLMISATSCTLVYNARNDANDLRPLPKPPFNANGMQQEKIKLWGDAEFLFIPKISSAYFVAMNKAVNRLKRAFKGTMVHELPAENLMCPIMTRKTLEFAIIKAVFGDSILFFADHQQIDTGKIINYQHIIKSLESGKIDLSDVKFVENAFAKVGESEMAKKYFVPYWQYYNEHVVSSDKYLGPNENALEIKVPAFGVYVDSDKYINYLPHPQTDQRALGNCFVTVAAAFSEENKGKVHQESKGSDLEIRKLYVDESLTAAAARDDTDAGDAFLKLETPYPYEIGSDKLPNDKYIKLFKTDFLPINFKPADFSPYETKIRMAVLVNLLNAIIPAKISPSKNVQGDPNATLFSTFSKPLSLNLKDFIYFKDGQYWVNSSEDETNPSGLPSYLKGWTGGIRTPGMTFWKYGVHSTTFQCTVDAFKYDDSVRLSTVVTFDLYDDKYDSEKIYDAKNPEIKNDHSKPKYELTPAALNSNNVLSAIYLNPLGRANKSANHFVIGNGFMRYPTDTNTDSWRILSSVWSHTFGRSSKSPDDYFVPVYLFPEDVLNYGPDGGSWHFEPHSYTDSYAFSSFFKDNNGKSSLYYSAPLGNNKFDYDFSTGKPLRRKYSFGKNSWVQWKENFTKTMAKDTLEVMVTRNVGSKKSDYVMDHELTLTRKDTNELIFKHIFSTKAADISPMVDTFKINVEVPLGEYYIRLTELKDSNPEPDKAEKITKIMIRGKEAINKFYMP